jgi:hypothetical protein
MPAFKATDAAFSVVEDQTGLFSSSEALYDNISFQKFSGRWRDAKLGRFSRNGKSLALARFFPAGRDDVALVLELQTQPLMNAAPDFPYAGMCHVESIPQAPLTAAPADKDLVR